MGTHEPVLFVKDHNQQMYETVLLTIKVKL